MCSAHWQYALKRRLTQRGLRCSQTQSSKHVCTAQNEKRTIWVSGSNTFYLILFSSGARVISQFLSPFWEEKKAAFLRVFFIEENEKKAAAYFNQDVGAFNSFHAI